MKVDRRTFVKGMAFAGGGAIGTLLSPAPWYLVRDLAFWTQNWSWVPVPVPGEPGSMRTICRMCEGGCGIKARMVDRRIVRIDGNEDHPVNKGSICPIGTAGVQMLYGPARIRYPMKNVGTRTRTKWEPISWARAIEEVAKKIGALRSAGKSHTVACLTSASRNTINELFERFLQAVGSRNYMQMVSKSDASEITIQLMQGPGAAPAYDIENARFILSFGCDLLEGWGSPGRMYNAHSSWLAGSENNKAEIVQVEPNLSNTAAKATRWIPIEPGTEAALALGMAYVIIKRELYDKAFVEDHCFGFEDWDRPEGGKQRGFKTEVLARYSPEMVELITKVPAKEIEELAVLFAASRPSIALGGRGSGDRFTNLYELMAIHSLNALVGNIGRKGGVLQQADVPLAPLPVVQMDEEASRGYAVARCDEAGGEKYPFTRHLPTNLNADAIEILFINEVNPDYVFSDRRAVGAMFGDIPYIVSFSSYMDETAARADLILPVPTPFERWDDQIGVRGLPFAVYNLNRPIIPPVHQTQNAADSLIAIARTLGGTIAESFPWNSLAEVLRVRARGLCETRSGMIGSFTAKSPAGAEGRVDASDSNELSYFSSFWSRLVEEGCWYDPTCRYDEPERSLTTSDRKFEFFSRRLRSSLKFSEDTRCMPNYGEPSPSPKGFDLLLMPKNLITLADDGKGTPPLLIKQLSDTTLKRSELFVQINPITAMHYDLKDGDRVILETSAGSVRVRIQQFAGVREGVVLIPMGLGHSGFDKFQRAKGVNARRLFEVKRDSISGLPAIWGTPARIIKA